MQLVLYMEMKMNWGMNSDFMIKSSLFISSSFNHANFLGIIVPFMEPNSSTVLLYTSPQHLHNPPHLVALCLQNSKNNRMREHNKYIVIWFNKQFIVKRLLQKKKLQFKTKSFVVSIQRGFLVFHAKLFIFPSQLMFSVPKVNEYIMCI